MRIYLQEVLPSEGEEFLHEYQTSALLYAQSHEYLLHRPNARFEEFCSTAQQIKPNGPVPAKYHILINNL